MTSTKLITAAALTALLFAGCKKNATTPGASNKIRVGYIGLTCEAPIFTAVEKGFFKEEGLDVELVKCEWANYKDVLALGGYDITHHLVMYFLKPIEQGLDVKFTAGIHKGCLRVQASTKGNIRTVQDLRGKRIGVPGMGTPPFIFANRVLGANGIDASKDVSWRVFPAGELGLALDKGEVDAVADSEPIGSLLLADGKVRNVADLAKRAFAHLEGVSDQWLESLQVEKVAGGQVPPDQDIRLYAELILSDTEESCCKAKPVLASQKETRRGLKARRARRRS